MTVANTDLQDTLLHQPPTQVAALRLAADQGDAHAQYKVGLMYHNGHGVPQNYVEAAKWYRLAADQGFAEAQFNLAFMYYNGQGVPQSYVNAHMWFILAAAQSNQDAVMSLGLS